MRFLNFIFLQCFEAEILVPYSDYKIFSYPQKNPSSVTLFTIYVYKHLMNNTTIKITSITLQFATQNQAICYTNLILHSSNCYTKPTCHNYENNAASNQLLQVATKKPKQFIFSQTVKQQCIAWLQITSFSHIKI